MKAFWWVFLILLAIIQFVGYGYFGKANPVEAVLLIGFLTTIVNGVAFTWLCEKKRFDPRIILLLATVLSLGPLSAARGKTSLFTHAMAEFLEYDISRLSGLVGTLEKSMGGVLYSFLIFLTFMVTIYITAAVCGFGSVGISYFRKLVRVVEEETARADEDKP